MGSNKLATYLFFRALATYIHKATTKKPSLQEEGARDDEYLPPIFNMGSHLFNIMIYQPFSYPPF